MWEPVTGMLTLIVLLFTLAAFLIGFFLAVIKWGQDASLEKYYRETIVKVLTERAYLPEPISEIPREIIVDSRQTFSPLRTYLKKRIARLMGKEVPPVILIFGEYSEEERKAFLIEKAFASSVESRLLDLDFLESLIHYLAYKYVFESEEIDEKVKTVLRKSFEGSKYRDCLVRLDSLDFSAKVVLNPPPVKRPLLTNVILPMIREKEKSLLETKAMISEIEKWKSLFMTLINNICSENCGVLFIGVRPELEYLDMMENGLRDYNFLIISARGTYIDTMLRIIKTGYLSEQSKPPEERIMTSCEKYDVIGMWEFPGEEKMICQWVILVRTQNS